MYDVRPEDIVRTSVNVADNLTKLFGIMYKGSQAFGKAKATAAATQGLLFTQGATSTLADGDTGTNPGTSGILDCSALDFHGVVRNINEDGYPDWEAWLIAARPNDPAYLSTVSAWGAASQSTWTSPFEVKLDGSVMDYLAAALTFNNQRSARDHHDGGVLHELLQVKNTWGSVGTGVSSRACKVYECDDIANTSTEIYNVGVPATNATEKVDPSSGNIDEPIASVASKRLVVKMSASTIPDNTDNNLTIRGRSYKFGPSIDKNKLMSRY